MLSRVSKVDSSRDLLITSAAHVAEPSSVSNASVQDNNVLLPSLSAPSVLAGRSEPAPDGVPSVPYPDGLGTYPGGPVATDAPSGATPTPSAASHLGIC